MAEPAALTVPLTDAYAEALGAPPCTPETPAAEYRRLYADHMTLRRLGGARTARQTARLALLDARLRAITATPPDGYALPAAAVQLIAHARAHGWQAEAYWAPPDDDGEGDPFVRVQVGRVMAPGELADARGNTWRYEAVWHSRGCPPGRLRLFGRMLARTPQHPATHDAPSVRAVREAIAAHPAP